MKDSSRPNGVPMELIDKHKQTQKLLMRKLRTMKGKDQPRIKRRKRKVRLCLKQLKLEKNRRKSE